LRITPYILLVRALTGANEENPVEKRKTAQTPTVLPKLDPIVIDAVTEMLMQDQGMDRPPEKTAALLTLIVELHKQKAPFPTRARVAEHVANYSSDKHCSIFTIDKALSSRMAQGYVMEAWEITEGNVAAQDSITRHRYYVPSKDLIAAATAAQNRAKSLVARSKELAVITTKRRA